MKYFLLKPHRIQYGKLGEEEWMDKAIILNVFDFVSFHVCKTLLEKGIEVKGIHVEDSEKEPFSEEKRLEIGRNANFEEQSLLSWANQENRDTTNTTIIFSLYDLFMLYKESVLQKEAVTKPILNLMERSDDIAIILPSQMLTSSLNSQELTDLQGFLDQAVRFKKNLQFLYLPTVYGPWQPETFLFQQSLLTELNRNEEFKGIREETIDAIYIDDAIESIIQIISAGKPDRYLLESGRKKHWDRCAAFLNLDENIVKRREMGQINSQIVTVTVKRVTSISGSLAKQKEHTQRLYSSY
jgi:hypothetical protein